MKSEMSHGSGRPADLQHLDFRYGARCPFDKKDIKSRANSPTSHAEVHVSLWQNRCMAHNRYTRPSWGKGKGTDSNGKEGAWREDGRTGKNEYAKDPPTHTHTHSQPSFNFIPW